MADSSNLVSNLPIENRGLCDILDLHEKEIKLSLNCHAIGTIQSFSSATQTANVKINYKRTFSQLKVDPISGITTKILNHIDYPLLVDVPVIALRGGLCHLTFPIASGDQCLVLFNDRDIDNWYKTGQISYVNSGRLHSLSDAIALVGLSNLTNPILPYDGKNAVLTDGTSELSVGSGNASLTDGVATVAASSGKVNVSIAADPLLGRAADTLGTELKNLCTQLTTLCTDLTDFCTTAANSTTDSTLVSAATTLGEYLPTINKAIALVSTKLGVFLA